MRSLYDSVRGSFFIILIGLNWGSLIILSAPFVLFCWAYDKKTTPKISWLTNTFLVQDLLTTVIMGGYHKTYISSLLGHMQKQGSKGGTYAAKVVNLLFYIARKEKKHCINAMKPDDIYDFSARRAIAGTLVYWLSLISAFLVISIF
jgi:hypothetical protein